MLWNVRRGNGTRSNSWQDKKIPPRCQSGWELCLRDHFPLFFFFLFFPLFEGVIERGITTNSPLNGNIMYPSPLFHVVVRDNLINRRTERGNQHFKRYFPCFYVLFFFFFFFTRRKSIFPIHDTTIFPPPPVIVVTVALVEQEDRPVHYRQERRKRNPTTDWGIIDRQVKGVVIAWKTWKKMRCLRDCWGGNGNIRKFPLR